MHISLKTCGQEKLQYIGVNDKGHSVEVAGNGQALSPMENLLVSVAGCSAVDVELILKKTRQEMTALRIDVHGVRADLKHVKPFSRIDLVYAISGQVKPQKAKQAVSLAVEKYCSVLLSLDPKITVNYGILVNGIDIPVAN